jgi:hypothetical protein
MLFPWTGTILGKVGDMGKKVIAFNNQSFPVAISSDGLTLAGLTSGEVDPKDPSAELNLAIGFLSLVAPAEVQEVAESISSDSESTASEDAVISANPEEVSVEAEVPEESEGVKPIRRKPSKEN